MSTTADLTARRAAAFQTAQAFATRADCGADLTATDRAAWDRALDEVESLTRQLRSSELDDIDRLSADDPDLRIYPAARRGAPTGRPGELLTRDQSLADHVAARGDLRGPTDLDVEKFWRGYLLQDWTDADAERRVMSEGVAGSGGVTVPTLLSAQLIDLARNQTRVFQAGAQTVPMDSNKVDVARQIGDPTIGWYAENASMTPSDLTFDKVTLTAKTLRCLVVASRELVEDAYVGGGLAALVTRALTESVAREFDRAALRGDGTANSPLGVRSASGVSVGALGAGNGAAPTWVDISNAALAVRSSNFEPSAMIDNPRTETRLAQLADTTGRYLTPPVDVADLPRLPTNTVPITLTTGTSTDCSEIYVGQWSELWFGLRTELQLYPLSERFADSGQIGFLAWARADVQLAHPAAFRVLTGVR